MKKYVVTYEALIRTNITIEANDINHARTLANNRYIEDSDFDGQKPEDAIVIEVEEVK